MTLLRWRRSFQARSIAASVAVCLLVWAGWSLWSLLEAGKERSHLFDTELQLNARIVLQAFPKALVAQSSPTFFELRPEDARSGVYGDYEFNYQVWTRDRRFVSRSATTPEQTLNPDFSPGFSSTQINGSTWRVYTLSDAKGEIQVQVGESVDQRKALVAHAARESFFQLLGLIGALVLGLVAAGWWAARPLRRLRDSVAQRVPGDHAPLPDHDLPSEVVPLVKAFNQLLQRSADARAAQRRFVGDAAHELRTPLAVLRVQAQVALRTRDATQRNAALARLVEGIDRSTRVAEQLLDLARLDELQADDPALRNTPVDVATLVSRTIDSTRSLAQRRQVRVQAQIDAAAVTGDAGLLGIALRNVLDNALRYSPAGASVQVQASQRGDAVSLSVIDSGPGLSAEQRPQAMQPFVRLVQNNQTSDEAGSGLGLSIVQRICALQDIRFELLGRASGQGVEARFTLTAAAFENRQAKGGDLDG